ncbi:peptidoglycan editing factor PgeF [Sphingosinicella sp. YJ22]|uniref:peptidoglycan editing factor PgeF n=1 Tax=Sphingosinicella sp. YJ22 TaxID=1104780 RepID=UPI00140CD171|nr:peptidoglycan editing factor PgeF [Sphingosinicella sp. YJ22]
MVEVIRSRLLDGVPHGFLGRRGGVSEGMCWGLNVGHGSGDDPALIAENRRRAVEAVAPGARLATVYQVHSSDAVIVGEPWGDDERPRADALVTDRPGVALGILTADCTPVLLADREAGVVGAAHAGWKGAFGGVLASTVEAMETLGAQRGRIVAAVGPTIGRKSYEVDADFFQRFLAADDDNDLFFTDGRAGHYRFDLEGYVLARLAAAGVKRIEALGLDTYSDEDRFYSYRRATHRGESNYGRQISIIAVPA